VDVQRQEGCAGAIHNQVGGWDAGLAAGLVGALVGWDLVGQGVTAGGELDDRPASRVANVDSLGGDPQVAEEPQEVGDVPVLELLGVGC
jgi:hypothetical protein